ncbi:MAG: restriction endonuclease [Sphingobacteriales bacterium]|nr:MAG: restriction endonuclease [Sphingobacteriales bacterium]
MAAKDHMTVFEHQALYSHKGDKRLSVDTLKALQAFYGEKGVPYYSLVHQGVKFSEFVGVIQVGKTLIEILPKADKSADGGEAKQNTWRNLLIGMLRAVGAFDIHSPSSSSLKLKSNSLLDLYFALFVKEVEYLLHQGLVKKYRKTEGNTTALKGSLLFPKHLQQNITHQERFYVRYTTYDVEHKMHFILYKALLLLKQINTNTALNSSIGALLLNFPEMPDIRVSEITFQKLVYTRKTEPYRKAIEIARLLLLNYHPDLAKGRNHVLALLFDMNFLWEQFLYVTLKNGLRRSDPDVSITAQTSKNFWKPETGSRSRMRPDIVINKGKPGCVVLDTKWKNLNGYNPSPEDLRQMYVYHEYFHAQRVALVYPGEVAQVKSGNYMDPERNEQVLTKECAVLTLPTARNENIKVWQEEINRDFSNWMFR